LTRARANTASSIESPLHAVEPTAPFAAVRRRIRRAGGCRATKCAGQHAVVKRKVKRASLHHHFRQRRPNRLRFTIKALGDHTKTLAARLESGQRAQNGRPLRTIRFPLRAMTSIRGAGGIGIAPFLRNGKHPAAQAGHLPTCGESLSGVLELPGRQAGSASRFVSGKGHGKFGE
jgi:hypothetical protein